ncbi:hypothetical protein ACHAXM_001481 [Skeletonema potamos]
MSSDRGCFKTVIFTDGEIVATQNKNSSLGVCFALPQCASRTDVLAADYPADELFMSFDDEEKNKKKDADVEEEGEEAIDLSAEFTGAFGLMEKDETGVGAKKNHTTTTSPPREVVKPSINASPRSVIFTKAHGSTPAQQKQQNEVLRAEKSNADDTAPQSMGLTYFNSDVTRDPISLEGYSIGDEANLEDLPLDISKEDAALEAKSLEVGDAAFILRSDCKWTYSIVIDKAVVPNGQSALRFEVGADNSRKTFMEAQWGKYIRVIKATKQNTVGKRNLTTAVVKKSEDANVVTPEDPDLSYYESDSDEDTLNDYANEDANQDSAEVKNSARLKGILRNKGENSLDRYLKSKVVERRRSEGNAGYSVHFNTTDDAESWTSDPLTIEQAFGTKKGEEEDSIGVKEEESKLHPTESKAAEVEVEGEEGSKPEPTESTAAEVEAVEVGVDFADIKNESPVMMTVKNVPTETESIDQTAPIVDENEDSALQTPTQLYKKGVELFNSGLSPIRLDLTTISPSLDCPASPSKIGESWDVGQLLFKLADPVFPWQHTAGVDLKNSTPIRQKPTLASTPLNDAVMPNEDVVDESLTIECELQNTADVKVHAVHVTPLPPAALQSQYEESKADTKVHNVRMTSHEDAIQFANELSMYKRDALNIHTRKGSVKASLGAISSMPALSKRERSIKNTLVAISKARSSKKAGKVNLDTLNITADTIDSYEVRQEKNF